jgi:hypothetical protein
VKFWTLHIQELCELLTPPDIVWIVGCWRLMDWACGYDGETRNAYRILVGKRKFEGRR